MPSLNRLRAAGRYLTFADPPWRWAASRSHCPLCGPAPFLSLKASAHLTRCLSCRATVTNLSLIPVIGGHFRSWGVDPRGASAYELSTYGSTLSFLRGAFGSVVTSEYMPGLDLGVKHAGVRNEDLQQLSFRDGEFELVTCNQVLEHVPDDRLGYAECLRVLRPGGALIFSVPMYDTPATAQVATLRDHEIHWLGTPEYHDSRLAGPNSSPVFWRHSRRDIADRVRAAGFRRVTLVDVMIARCQRAPAPVVYAVK